MNNIIKSFQFIKDDQESLLKIIDEVTVYTDVHICMDGNLYGLPDDSVTGIKIGGSDSDLEVHLNEWINIYPDGKISVTSEPV